MAGSITNTVFYIKSNSIVYTGALNLSKSLSDLKQSGTQEKTTFSGRVIYALSQGMVCFASSSLSAFDEF